MRHATWSIPPHFFLLVQKETGWSLKERHVRLEVEFACDETSPHMNVRQSLVGLTPCVRTHVFGRVSCLAAYHPPPKKAGRRFRRANRLRRQNERATLHFRINAKTPYPLLHSSLPSRKSSLRLGDACRPYSAKAILLPTLVAGGFQRGAHIPLWRAFFAALPRFFPTRERNGVTDQWDDVGARAANGGDKVLWECIVPCKAPTTHAPCRRERKDIA